MVDHQKSQISDLHFDKFLTPSTFSCCKVRFKTEVCACSGSPSGMFWIKDVEVVDPIDDLKSSRSVQGHQFPNFQMLDEKIASSLNKTIKNFLASGRE